MDKKRLFGARIKEIRRKRNLSQERLAEKADINSKYLSRIERGTENPTFDLLIKLAHALDVEMWEMFDFGHIKSRKELKDAFNGIIKMSDESSLRLAFKVVRALSR